MLTYFFELPNFLAVLYIQYWIWCNFWETKAAVAMIWSIRLGHRNGTGIWVGQGVGPLGGGVQCGVRCAVWVTVWEMSESMGSRFGNSNRCVTTLLLISYAFGTSPTPHTTLHPTTQWAHTQWAHTHWPNTNLWVLSKPHRVHNGHCML